MEPREPHMPDTGPTDLGIPEPEAPTAPLEKSSPRRNFWPIARDVVQVLGSAAGVLAYLDSRARDDDETDTPDGPVAQAAPPATQNPRHLPDWNEFDTEQGVLVLREQQTRVVLCYGFPSLVAHDGQGRCRDWNYPNSAEFSIVIPLTDKNVYARQKTSYAILRDNTPEHLAELFLDLAPKVAGRHMESDASYHITLLGIGRKGCKTSVVDFQKGESMSTTIESFRSAIVQLKRK